VIESCNGLGLGHGSRVMRVTGQLNDGSRWSKVTTTVSSVSLTDERTDRQWLKRLVELEIE